MLRIPPFTHRLAPLPNDFFAHVQIAQTLRCKELTADTYVYCGVPKLLLRNFAH